VLAIARKTDEFLAKKQHLANQKWLTLKSEDVRRINELPKETEWIIHLAGTPDGRVHASDPYQAADTIVNGTSRVLEIASLLPSLKKFLNLSSGLIYGRHNIEVGKINESMNCTLDCSKIGSTYPEAKRMSEIYTHIYRSQFRIPVVNLRPFAFIGPYQLLDRPWAINNFIRDALKGGPIRILGDEQTIRSYMYPSDMAYWILKALTQANDGATLNLGSPYGLNLAHVAQAIARNFQTPPSIMSNVAHKGIQSSCLVPDVALAKDSLDLEITVDFETAIARTIQWFKLEH
jgi:dTDP-glucose 4,6-dehydratase